MALLVPSRHECALKGPPTVMGIGVRSLPRHKCAFDFPDEYIFAPDLLWLPCAREWFLELSFIALFCLPLARLALPSLGLRTSRLHHMPLPYACAFMGPHTAMECTLWEIKSLVQEGWLEMFCTNATPAQFITPLLGPRGRREPGL